MRRNIMKQIEEIIRNTTEEQEKVDWTKAWSTDDTYLYWFT